MREINSVLGFLSWAEATIRRSEIQVPIPIGLLRKYHDVFRHFEGRGSFTLGSDASAWGSYLGSLLESLHQENGRTTGASALVDYFLGELYSLAISAKGTATLTDLVAATRCVLDIAAADLYLNEQGNLLRSSPAFDERFFHRVRVPIPRKPTGNVATHRSHAPHGTGRRLIR